MGNNYNRIRISSNCVKLMGNNYVVLLYLKLCVHISCQYTKSSSLKKTPRVETFGRKKNQKLRL